VNTTISEVAADSAIGRGVERVRHVALAAWNTSRTARILRRSDARWRDSPAPLRIQTVALLVACVSAGQILSRWILPPYALSGLPMFWFITVTALAGLAAVMAAPLASAWPESGTAKAVRAARRERRS
jgi:hypothetical protein